MPLCGHHHIFYKIECSFCAHDRAVEEKAEKKADAKRAVILAKQKIKAKEAKPKISKQSAKQKVKNLEYSARVKEWKLGKMCVVFLGEPATTCHHAKGRIGYADQWARDLGITLLMDERYWIPASLEGHRWIEEHPQEAKDRGWSQSRLENLYIENPTI